jgi:hypothetical protein
MSLESVLVALGLDAFWRAGTGEVSLTSGKIDTAFDLTGHGFDVAQAVAGARPTQNLSWLNGAPSMVFSAGQALTRAANIMTSAVNWTMGLVWSTNSVNTGQFVFRPCSGGGAGPTINEAATNKREIFVSGVGIIQNGLATTSPEVWIISRDTSAISLYLGLSGAAATLDFPGVAPAAPSGALTTIGALNDALLLPLNGNIGEVWFVQRLLSGSERTSYLGYVSQRYWTVSSTVTSALGALSSTASATEALDASGSSMLSRSSSGGATETVSSSASSAAGAIGGNASATERLPSASSSALGAFGGAGAGTETLSSSSTSALGALSSASAAFESMGSTGTSMFTFDAAAIATERLGASAVSTLPLGSSGVAVEALDAAAASRLEVIDAAASAILGQGAVGASALARLIGAGTSTERLPTATVSLLGKIAGSGTAHHTLPFFAGPRLRAQLIGPTRLRATLVSPTRLRALLTGSKP